MSSPAEKYIEYEDSRVHYTVIGKGMPVLLVHGFAEDGTVWDNQVSFLKKYFLLIIPDIPGSGRSILFKNRNRGMEDYAACLKTILAAENIDQCVMIGHSMGGYITLAFADLYPESLMAFGLFHSSAYADDSEKIQSRKKGIDFIKTNGAQAFLKSSLPGLFFDTEKSRNDIEMLLQRGNKFSNEALIQYYEAMIARPDRTAVLKNTILPVLMIMGQQDKAVPFKFSLEQAPMPTYTYIYILRNSAHMGMLEEMEKSNNILADFLHIGHVK